MLWYILATIFMIFLGIGIFLKPTLLWNLTERWKSYHADEPSNLYLISTKFGGILIASIGLILTILLLVVK